MAEKILTRYGLVDQRVAASARHIVALMGDLVAHSLGEAHQKLLVMLDIRDASGVYPFESSPSDRWTNLMVELFGVEQRDLLDSPLTPDAVSTCLDAAPPEEIQAVTDIVAAASMSLVAEADRSRQCIDFLPETVDETIVRELEKLVDSLATLPLALNRHVAQGKWSQLLEVMAPTHSDDRQIPTAPTEIQPAKATLGGFDLGGKRDGAAVFVAYTGGGKTFAQLPRSAQSARCGWNDRLNRLHSDCDLWSVRKARERKARELGRIARPSAAQWQPVYDSWRYYGDFAIEPDVFFPERGSGQPDVWFSQALADPLGRAGNRSRALPIPLVPAARENGVEWYDRVFRGNFGSDRRSTLLVVGFTMGNWIAGKYISQLTRALRARGHKISAVVPGTDAVAVLTSIAAMKSGYDQIIFTGYPPFVRDVLDRAAPGQLPPDLKLLLAGDNITEEWRDHTLERIGKASQADQICLIYGTIDAGIVGHETPTTIAVRRLARDDPRLSAQLFGADNRLPILVEYDPRLRHGQFDHEERTELIGAGTSLEGSGSSVARLVSPEELSEVLCQSGHQLPVYTSYAGAEFFATYRRSDYAASFYSVKLYSEDIRSALQAGGIKDTVSGKFVLSTKTNEMAAQTLGLHVELRTSARPPDDFREFLRKHVTAVLDRTNHAYRQLHATIGAAAEPIITLGPPEDETRGAAHGNRADQRGLE